MNRLKPRRAYHPQPSDEEQAMMMAATMIGYRIIRGITDEQLATSMGVLHDYKTPRRNGAMKREIHIARLVRQMELDMTDHRVSTLQRYARSLGAKFDIKLYGPPRRYSVVARGRAIRRHKKVAAKNCWRPHKWFAI